MKTLKKLLFALALAYFPCLLLYPLSIDQSASWWQTPYYANLLVCFMISFPFYLAFIELLLGLCRLADKKVGTRGEKILNIFKVVIALCIAVLAVAVDHLYSAVFYLSVLLVLLWVIGAVVFKKKPALPTIFRQKSFWIYVFAIFLIISSITFAIAHFKKSENKIDHYAENSFSFTLKVTVAETLPSCITVKKDKLYCFDDNGNL